MMRIVGGSAAGRAIKSPPGHVRPATARVRKALFDYLSGFITGARVLDLYCGSGGLGLEAVSRGASEAWFVDISERSIDVARENAASLGMIRQTHFIHKDVFRFLNQFEAISDRKFDLIFAAPPYRTADPQRILNNIAEAGVLEAGSAVCLEYSHHTEAPASSRFRLDRKKVYGETVIDVWDFIIER